MSLALVRLAFLAARQNVGKEGGGELVRAGRSLGVLEVKWGTWLESV